MRGHQYVTCAFEAWKEADREILMHIRGTSMLPLIKPADRVLIRPLDPHHLNRGDIFAFWMNGSVVVHRYIRKKKVEGSYWYCQKGDHLSGWSWVPENRVIGRVESIQGKTRMVRLSHRPWPWLNSLLGCLIEGWIRLREKYTQRGH